MHTDSHGEDVRAIETLIARQFASLTWTPETPARWDAFAADFLPEAALYPSVRPAHRRTVNEFIERMKGLAATRLRTFNEVVLGTDVQVFGNVAVAVVVCEMTENGSEVNRNVEMMLLVKDGEWRVVAQAWDSEGPGKPIPAHLTGGPARD